MSVRCIISVLIVLIFWVAVLSVGTAGAPASAKSPAGERPVLFAQNQDVPDPAQPSDQNETAADDEQKNATTLQVALENRMNMVFVHVAPGTFSMGSPEDENGRDSDEIQHQVTLTRDFYIQAQEVTNRQFVLFLNEANRRSPPHQPWFQTRSQDRNSHILEENGAYRVADGYGAHPVVEVSWYGARAFADWLTQSTGRRCALPTEAQWEYACRASTTSRYFWGQDAECSQMMFENSTADDNGNERDACVAYVKRADLEPDAPAPVGSYPANPWGIYDMHGNVWEWCKDRYGEYPDVPVVNPSGAVFSDPRALRGGSWENSAGTCRSANRYSRDPATRNASIGFRVIYYP